MIHTLQGLVESGGLDHKLQMWRQRIKQNYCRWKWESAN